MTFHRCVRVLSFTASLFIVPAAVSAQDIDAMAKWTALTIVHYRVVGEYSGEEQFFKGGSRLARARATDRLELEFDWDQFEMKLAGSAKVTNSPTQFTPIAEAGCPPLRVDGQLEIATVTEVKGTIPGIVTLVLKQDVPAVGIPWTEDDKPCGTLWDQSAAKSQTTEQMVQVMPAMMLAMGPSPNVTPDGKSMVVKAQQWTWTLTPTPVR